MSKKYTLHKSCSTIPIYSFYEILKTDDYRYLIKDYFGENKKAYTKLKHSKKLRLIFETILKQFILISDKNNSGFEIKKVNDFKNKLLLTELRLKYNTTSKILNIYSSNESLELLLLLVEVGWEFDVDLPYGPQIDKISKACLGLKNQIKIKEASLNNKAIVKKSNNKEISLSKQAIYLQNNLGLNYFLDVRVCTAEAWLNLLSLDDEKQKYLKDKNG
jgi:hypothetical protein